MFRSYPKEWSFWDLPTTIEICGFEGIKYFTRDQLIQMRNKNELSLLVVYGITPDDLVTLKRMLPDDFFGVIGLVKE